jgi:hypothetical protein
MRTLTIKLPDVDDSAFDSWCQGYSRGSVRTMQQALLDSLLGEMTPETQQKWNERFAPYVDAKNIDV